MGSASTASPAPIGSAMTAEMRSELSVMLPTSSRALRTAAAVIAGTTAMLMGVMKAAGRL